MEDELALAILDYLLAQGTKSLKSLLRHDSKYIEYSNEHDCLGWDNFLEGRVSNTLFQLQHKNLARAGSTWRIKTYMGKEICSISLGNYTSAVELPQCEGAP